MTTTAAALSLARRGELQAEAEAITRELQAGGADLGAAAQRLLRRARVYADMGDGARAREDIARAAALARDPEHGAAEDVAAVERALREISVSAPGAAGGALGAATDEELVARAASDSDGGSAAAELEARVGAKRARLDSAQICRLVDAFHERCARGGADGDAAAAAALASCVGAAVARIGGGGGAGSRQSLAEVAGRMARGWERRDADGAFKQRACSHGASMYAAAAHALATLGGQAQGPGAADGALGAAYAFYVHQVWPVGSLPDAAGGAQGGVCQGALRLLAGSAPHFVAAFVSAGPPGRGAAASPMGRLLGLLGQPQASDSDSDSDSDGGGRGAPALAMLVASQVVGAARDPANSALLPGHDPAATAAAGGPATALARLRATAAEVLDAWVQSTAQAERARGLRALAALYEAGAGAELAAELWLRSGWAEDLWDQGEFDRGETQAALLRLADACSADGGSGARMKRLGSGLVQALARGPDAALAELAAVVLAKWSGLPAAPAAAKPGQGAAEKDGAGQDTPDADPIQLADTHIRRIAACAGAGAGADLGAAERSAEALAYLCLRPQLKEHVARSDGLLAALFGLARGAGAARAGLRFAAVMLIGNLTRYRPVLSDEQRRMQQLQRLGAGEKKKADQKRDQDQDQDRDSPLDAPEAVAARARLVCGAGGAAVLVAAAQGRARASDAARDAVAEALVSLATSPGLRGLLVQQGAVPALLGMQTGAVPAVAGMQAGAGPGPLRQKRDRDVALALAKIAVSVPPHLAFRDPRAVARLLLALLAEDADPQALLMRFEALLALTNLASAEPGSPADVRGYIAALGGVPLVEAAMLSDHPLVRRAATELVCNLVCDAAVFERYVRGADRHVPAGPESAGPRIVELPSDEDEAEPDEGDPGPDPDGYRAQRLHLLVALADVDDAATRSAAAGALAVLSSDARCCRYLFLAHPRAAAVLLRLATDGDDDDDDDDSADDVAAGFRHRVAVVWANAARCGDARVAAALRAQRGVVDCLQRMAADPQAPGRAAAESALATILSRPKR
ncbi:SWI5-dependent HO expression protein 4 [Coemansia javaensis]|uniref:SWI5-dependent HO expression protein 4 n=1 Tax=Coemansia javaensis TaxID=2761396 RepID=A0A9W8HGR6_9FUNG|nr:SWI5-dependent HO expression protein 4 [Coemansia javaensis]